MGKNSRKVFEFSSSNIIIVHLIYVGTGELRIVKKKLFVKTHNKNVYGFYDNFSVQKLIMKRLTFA